LSAEIEKEERINVHWIVFGAADGILKYDKQGPLNELRFSQWWP
jgi:hypothetical protein